MDWTDLNNLEATLSRPAGISNGAVEIDAFQLKVTYEYLDVGRRLEDRFYTYGLAHRVTSSEKNGHRQTFTYNDKGNMLSKNNEVGELWTYVYHTNFHKPIYVTDPKNNITRMDYGSRGNLIQETDPLNQHTRYSYDAHGNLIRTTDPLGVFTEYSLDTLGIHIMAIKDKNGNTSQFLYDQIGNPIQETDPAQNTHQIAYNQYNAKTQEVDRAGTITKYFYDKNARLTNVVFAYNTPEQTSMSYICDVKGRIIEEIDALGHHHYSEYDAYGKLTSKIDRLGNTNEFKYDVYSRLTAETDALGFTNHFSYDGNGNVLTSTDKRGLTTTKTYDHNDQVLIQIDPLGNHVSNQYDKNGNPIKQIITTHPCSSCTNEPQILVATFEIDARNQMIKRTVGVGRDDPCISENEYDELGRLIKEIDALGHYKVLEYDGNGQATQLTTFSQDDNLLGRVSSVYNQRDLLTQTITYPDPSTVCASAFEYDARGLKTAVIDPRGHRTETTYDAYKRVQTVVDAENNTNSFIYDALNQVSNIIDAAGNHVQLEYDGKGQLWQQTDQRGNITRSIYDVYGQLKQMTDSEGNTASYQYDLNGNKIVETDTRGVLAYFFYDGANRVTNKMLGVGRIDAQHFSYTYDQLSRVLHITDPLGYAETNMYDANNNVVIQHDKRGFTTRISYDNLNRLTNTIDALNFSTTYQYDSLGAVLKATDKRGYSQSYAYDIYGQKISMTDVENNTTYMAYDVLGQPTNSIDASGFSQTTVYDPNGNVILAASYNRADLLLRQTGSHYDNRNLLVEGIDAHGFTTHYEYDALGRKTATVTPLGGRVEVVYDLYGNTVESKDELGHVTRTIYDRRNQPIKIIDALGFQTRYRYDKNGNRISVTDDNGNTICTHYDKLNRVVEVNKSMADLLPVVLKRSDVNSDGRVDASDMDALTNALAYVP
ncbi:MAG: hypothetical protein GKR87_06945 [Kiritimatiellae bacterium]|nr:hypothetical protein [Kiritimatiellia bacterium]